MNARMSSSSHRLHSKYLGLTIVCIHIAWFIGDILIYGTTYYCMGRTKRQVLYGDFVWEPLVIPKAFVRVQICTPDWFSTIALGKHYGTVAVWCTDLYDCTRTKALGSTSTHLYLGPPHTVGTWYLARYRQGKAQMGWSLIDHACIGLCRGLLPHWIHDLKSTYCFYAHMHEITKYFLFTENQQQCPLSGLGRSLPSSESSIWGRVTFPSEFSLGHTWCMWRL